MFGDIESRKKVVVTINKANKILENLRTFPRLIRNVEYYMNCYVTTTANNSKKDFLEYKKDWIKQTCNTYDMLFDYSELKIRIFKINADFGINEVLNKLEMYRSIKVMLEANINYLNNKSNFKSEEDLTDKFFSDVLSSLNKEGLNNIPVSFLFESKKSIETMILHIKKLINTFEDEKVKLNATEIEIFLFPKTIEYLGL